MSSPFPIDDVQGRVRYPEHTAGPWIVGEHQADRRDLHWDDWAFGVWQSYDPATGDPNDPKTWRLRWWWCKHRSVGGHVDTREEAMAAADACARSRGWRLIDAMPEPQEP